MVTSMGYEHLGIPYTPKQEPPSPADQIALDE